MPQNGSAASSEYGPGAAACRAIALQPPLSIAIRDLPEFHPREPLPQTSAGKGFAMLGIRSFSIFIACCCAFVLAHCPPLLAAAVTSPSSRTAGNPANAVTLKCYVEKAGQTVTIQAVDQNTGALVTLGTTKAAMSGRRTRRRPAHTTRPIRGASPPACLPSNTGRRKKSLPTWQQAKDILNCSPPPAAKTSIPSARRRAPQRKPPARIRRPPRRIFPRANPPCCSIRTASAAAPKRRG